VGFEPTKGYYPLLVFKTSAFSRSATSPNLYKVVAWAYNGLTQRARNINRAH
jgi:hypothetical protein